MEKIKLKDYLGKYNTYIKNKNQTVFGYTDETCVLQGVDDLDFDYCKEHKIPVYKTHQFGGNIINFVGDLCIANYQETFNNYGPEVLFKLRNMLINKGLNASVDANDLLVDSKYKVASYMSTYIDGCLYTAIHISINIDIEIINAICKKPINKIPKGLSSYGISLKDVEILMGQ